MDIPCAPILTDIVVDGRKIKALAQPTKQSFLYVFNRETGEPVWPIEERPVPAGNVPGEWYAPTQPFPTKPPPYNRQGTSIDDLIDFTPEMRKQSIEIASRYTLGPIFTPPVVSTREGPLGILTSVKNGTIWEGGSFDPETQILYVFSEGAIGAIGLVPPDAGKSDMAFVQGSALTGARATGGGTGAPVTAPVAPAPPVEGGGGGGLTVQGLPLHKPPYGSIAAIDLSKGDILWKIAHGDSPDVVRNHPALKGLNIPRTGRPGNIGTLVTKTLLIAGEGSFATTPSGRGAMLRAYDKATGADAGAVYMPAPQTGSPMTYMLNGRQYIVVAISGGTYSGELLAFRLPAQ
jgi:quinoprotein glucose dehydrogenase